MGSRGELEFRQELASKICMVVERYAPNRKWHIDRIIQVMATTTSTGFNREQEVIANMFILVSNSPNLQSYCTFKLYECISKLQLNSDAIRQITSWLIGEYGDKLMSLTECEEANDELMKDKRNGSDEEDSDHKMNGIENMTLDIGPFEVKTTDEIITMLKYMIKHDKSSETTKGFGLTALMKIRHKYQQQDIDKDDKIDAILESFEDDKQIEVQQRSVEFLSLFANTDQTARAKILKPMPVPKIERLFDESRNNLKSPRMSDDDTGSSGTETETETESEQKSDDDKSDVDKDTDKSGSDSASSESSSEKRRKRRKKEKEEKRDRKRKDKKKDRAPVIPVLIGPEETQTNGPKIDDVQSPIPARNGSGNGSINMNGNSQPSKPPSNQMDDLLNFGSSSQPSQPAQKPNNSIDDLLNIGGSSQPSTNNSMDPLGLLSSPQSQTPQSTSPSGKPQPFEAYNKNGIVATFNFAPSQAHGVSRVLAVFHNSNSYQVDDFSFMIAVPKYIKLQFKNPNGNKLMALNGNSITQKFQLSNTMYPQKPFIIRVQVIYTANGQQMKDRSQVTFPDNCC